MNESVNVKDYEFDNPLFYKKDSLLDKCIRDCNNKFYHTFDHICVYDIDLTNIINDEINNGTISDGSMSLY